MWLCFLMQVEAMNKLIAHRFILLFALVAPLTLIAPRGFSGELEQLSVQSAWIKLAPPGASVNAAYMRLHNDSSAARIVVAVSADCCEQVMMHESRREGDRVFMAHRDKLEVSARSELVLAPGGLHLMLIGAREPLMENNQVKISLNFADGTQQLITVPVRRAAND